MGGDKPTGPPENIEKVSIHAPAWGATPFKEEKDETTTCFNPRPRMGGD